MPRCVRPSAYGSPEVLEIVDVPTLRAPDGGVVVAVRAAGVNPIDWKLYSGSFHAVDDDHQDAAGITASMPVLALVADRARIASIAGTERRAEAGGKVLGYGPGQDAGTEVRAAARPELARTAGAGLLRVIVAGTFPLTEAATAHEAGIAGHAPGKLVLLP